MIQLEAFFKISYGLYIVSSGSGKNGNGFISNSVFQVTAEPPKFAACCNKDNYTAELIKEHGAYSISVLEKETPSTLIGKFGYKSGRNINKFDGSKVKKGKTGVPIVLDNTISYIECKVEQTIDVGTHLIFIGEVVSSELLDHSKPLTYAYYREAKKGIAPKNAPTYIDKAKLQKKEKQSIKASKYKCPTCGYIYHPAIGDDTIGIPPGTAFEDLPQNWVCPLCGTEKEDFERI